MDPPSPESSRERLQFRECEVEAFSDGRVRTRVVLRTPGGDEISGESTGLGTLENRLRSGARAAIEAISRAVDDEIRFELTGVKSTRAFDGFVVITALRAESETECSRLLGVYSASEDDRIRGAALAVLNATNRILGNFIATTD